MLQFSPEFSGWGEVVKVCHDQLLLAVVDWWGLAVSASIGMSGAPRCVGQGKLGVSRTAYNHDLHHQQNLHLVLKVKMWVEETVGLVNTTN